MCGKVCFARPSLRWIRSSPRTCGDSLGHAPQLLTCLGQDDCDVRLASDDLLDLFHDVRMRDAGFVGRFAQQLNQRTGDRRTCAYRAARLLLREAERRWDSMEQPLRDSVLALPIHRAADGSIISLLPEGETASGQIRERFFLQSEDDLRDAPFEPRTGQLLHSIDPDLRSFYRHRLRIREQGRIEVLKECLRQIGTDVDRNSGHLEVYRAVLQRHGGATARARQRGTDDLRELKELHRAARGIPCLDGNWRSAVECVDASPVRQLLEKQGWKGRRLHDLLFWLELPPPVAEASSDEAKLARTLWEVQEWIVTFWPSPRSPVRARSFVHGSSPGHQRQPQTGSRDAASPRFCNGRRDP